MPVVLIRVGVRGWRQRDLFAVPAPKEEHTPPLLRHSINGSVEKPKNDIVAKTCQFVENNLKRGT
jgi:hypothetical protein